MQRRCRKKKPNDKYLILATFPFLLLLDDIPICGLILSAHQSIDNILHCFLRFWLFIDIIEPVGRHEMRTFSFLADGYVFFFPLFLVISFHVLTEIISISVPDLTDNIFHACSKCTHLDLFRFSVREYFAEKTKLLFSLSLSLFFFCGKRVNLCESSYLSVNRLVQSINSLWTATKKNILNWSNPVKFPVTERWIWYLNQKKKKSFDDVFEMYAQDLFAPAWRQSATRSQSLNCIYSFLWSILLDLVCSQFVL